MIIRITSLLLALTLSSGGLSAQVPTKMSYQGVLTDGSGAPVADGNHSLVFKLYSVSTAGSALWTETQATVNTTNGVLSVVLGSVTPIGIAFDGALWLGIEVDGGGELTPRTELTTSPYSFHAKSVDDDAVTSAKIADGTIVSADVAGGEVVTSVNTLKDAVTLAAGANVTITPAGNTLTFASSAAGGNNLDMAYDEGGAGVGRTITADNGAVDITGTGGLQVTDGGVLFTGTTGTIPATGAGTRLMWYPAKGALRAGKTTGTDWDDVNIGTSSTITGGEGNAASGAHATVSGGFNNAASGQHGTVAGGEGSLAGGISATVPGGKDNVASGDYSFAAGQRAKANHAGAFVWADQMAADFASTAVDQFLIRATGGVGIGTASPSAIFHTSKDTGPNWSYITNNGAAAGDHAGLWFATDHDGTADWAAIGIYDGDGKLRLTGSTALSTPGMTLDNSNNVGIGTTTPSVPLVVHRASGTNSVYISNDGAGAGDQNHLWFISDRDGTADWAGVGIQNADGQLRLTGTNSLNVPGMTLDNGNNIGIGTTTPATNLPAAFNDDSGNAKILDIRSAVAGDVGLFLSRADGSTTGMQMWTDYSAGHTYFDNLYDNADGDIRFRTRTAGTAVDALHIQGDGNVGIGTTTPGTLLHLFKGHGEAIRLTNSGFGDNSISTFGDGSGPGLFLGANAYLDAATAVQRHNAGQPAWDLSLNASGGDRFAVSRTTAGGTRTEHMHINGSGNVGIGTASPGNRLHVVDASGAIAQFQGTGGTGPVYIFDGTFSGIGTGTAIPFSLATRTSSSTRLTVDGTGNVGIGTATPTALLEVAGDLLVGGPTAANKAVYSSSNAHLRLLSGNTGGGALLFEAGTPGAPTEHMRIDGATGNIGIGTAVVTEKLMVAGNVVPSADNTYTSGSSTNKWSAVWSNNGTIQTSDRRLKENIEASPYGLDEVMNLRPVSYTWKDRPEQGRKVGLIAQEVRPLVSEVVHVGDDEGETLGLNYADLVPVLAKAIQEQQQIIERQQLERIEMRIQLEQTKAELNETRTSMGSELDDLKSELRQLVGAVHAISSSISTNSEEQQMMASTVRNTETDIIRGLPGEQP